MEKELKQMFEDYEKRISKLERIFCDEKITTVKKKISAKEFIIDVNAKDDVQRTAAFGLFLEKYEGLPCFNVKDILELFRKAKEKPPKNINDKINKCISRSWVMEYHEKKNDTKAFVLTNSGEKAVDSKFNMK